MSRSFKYTPVHSYSGKSKRAYKRLLNSRARHTEDLPNGGGYRKLPYDWESLHGWFGTKVYHTRESWEAHVRHCWTRLGTRYNLTEADVLRYIRRPLVK